MSKYSYFVIIFSLFLYPLSSFSQDYTIIEGKIAIPAGKDVSVTVITDLLKGDKAIISTPVDYNGEFKLAFKISEQMLVRFEHAFENMMIFVAPGERFKITFEAERMWQTIKFEGSSANNNNYMPAYYNKFNKEVDQTYINLEADGMTARQFVTYADSLKNAKMRFYEEYKKKYPFTHNFDEYAKGDILYNWAYDKLRFAATQYWQTGDSYFKFLSQIPISNEKLIASNSYNFFLLTYFDYLYEMKKLNGAQVKNPVAEKFEQIKANLRGNLMYYIAAQMLVRACQNNDIADVEPPYNQFVLMNPYAEYAQFVGETFRIAKKFAPGSPAPDFILFDTKGEPVALSDFRGKVVYIDFWASWCNPCLQQMKYLKEIKQDLKGQDVVFLYVSIDTDEKAWKNMIEKRQIDGIHVRTNGPKSEMAQEYNVQGVPVYFMVDKEGNFAAKPPLPSARTAFVERVERLISAKKQTIDPNDSSR